MLRKGSDYIFTVAPPRVCREDDEEEVMFVEDITVGLIYHIRI